MNDKFEQMRTNLRNQEKERKQRQDEQERLKKEQQLLEQQQAQKQKEEDERKRRDEEQRLKKKEQERQLKQKIRTAWEFRFYQGIQDCLDSLEHFDNSMKSGLKLIKFMEQFREEAFTTVKELICELLDRQVKKDQKTESQFNMDQADIKKTIFTKRQNKEADVIQEYQEQLSDCFDGKFTFKKNNMIINIATSTLEDHTMAIKMKTNYFKSLKNQLTIVQQFNEYVYYQTQVHCSQNKRQISDEFKSLDYLNDMCFTIKQQDRNFRLKVPLACIVEYLGFKALVVAQPPSNLDETTLVYGLQKNENYKQEKSGSKQERELESLGRYLAIKPHFFSIQKDKRFGIYLSIYTEIHAGRYDEFQQLKSQLKMFENEDPDNGDRKQTGIFYLNKTKELLPILADEHYAELVELINLAKSTEDNDFVTEPTQQYEFRRARPEFIQSYYDSGVQGYLRSQQSNMTRKLYNPDAYESTEDSNEIYQDQLSLAEMSKTYFKSYLIEFTHKLDNLEICPIDSYSFREAFKLYGINICHLGLVAKATLVPHIRTVCEQEMMARSIKNIFMQHFTEFLTNITEDNIPLKALDIRTKKDVDTDEEIKRSNFKKFSILVPPKISQERTPTSDYIENEFKEMLLDLLNMVFSKNNLFYEQILFKQVYHDFNYDLQITKWGICPGGLLMSIMQVFKIDVLFDPFEIFLSTPYPYFEQEQVIQKYGIKQYIHQKSHQIYFKTSQIQVQQTPQLTPQGRRTLLKPQQKKRMFETQSIQQLRFDVQNYKMQEIDICKLINKYNLFKQQKNYTLALKVLYIRLNLISGLEHSSNIQQAKCLIYTDIAEVYLKTQKPFECVQKIAQAFHSINNSYPQISDQRQSCIGFIQSITNLANKFQPRSIYIRPLLILLEITTEFFQDLTYEVFDLLLFVLEFCFGHQHHLYAKVFHIMSQYFLKIGRLEDVSIMQNMQIVCLIQTLGHQHQMTADTYVMIGDSKPSPEDKLIYYEKAYYIYETIFSENSPFVALIQAKLARAFSDCGKMQDAIKLSQASVKNLKGQDQLLTILEMQLIKALNYLRNTQRDQSRKECEQFFNIIISNWDYIQESQEQDVMERDLSQLPPEISLLIREICRIYLEIFLFEIQKEHRNFLFQLFDQVVEQWARQNQLEFYDQNYLYSIIFILKKVRQFGIIQAFLENMLSGFVDKTGGDANYLIFNFKNQTQDSIKEALESYENIIIAVDRKLMSRIFEKVMISQI